MKRTFLLAAGLALALSSGAIAAPAVVGLGTKLAAPAAPTCFDSVKVTGYYVPVLADYDSKATATINIGGQAHLYNASFIAEATMKGGGVSAAGENLLYQNSTWTIQSGPLTPVAGWYPIEKDFTTLVSVKTAEAGMKGPYPKAFIDTVDLDGSGKIAGGKFLGRPWDGKWHFRGKALDASEREVQIGVVAVDPKFFNKEHPLPVTITPSPVGFSNVSFQARDKGPAIVGQHIDVFTGYGLDGLQHMVALTSDGNKACFGK